jgi:hypothetical protein
MQFFKAKVTKVGVQQSVGLKDEIAPAAAEHKR